MESTHADNWKQKPLIIFCVVVVLAGVFFLKKTGIFGLYGRHKVSVVKDTLGGYQLYVEGRPFVVKGICYQPIPIGQNYTYNFFSSAKKILDVDGPLLQALGANAVRIYQAGKDLDQTRRFIRYLYKKFGIRVIMGDWLGFWEMPAYGYADKEFRKKVTQEVLRMVGALKDEPGILFWVLGNENNRSFGPQKINYWCTPEMGKLCDLDKQKMQAKIYYEFVNELARKIKGVDPRHPVAIGNAGMECIGVAAPFIKDVDILAITSFPGKSFGNLFREAKRLWGRSLLILEFGCDRYDAKQKKEVPETQAKFISSQWREIYRHLASEQKGGIVIGGCIFEWSDEWWKADELDAKSWSVHNTESQWSCGGYYFDIGVKNHLNMNEEWWGIVALGPVGENGVNQRLPQAAYNTLKEIWGGKGKSR